MRRAPSQIAFGFLAAWALATGFVEAKPVEVIGRQEVTRLSRRFQKRSWSGSSAIARNRINQILQTRDGHLWLATADGLVRFDGHTTLSLSHRITDAFVSDDCTCLAEEISGHLWIGTADGLLHFDGQRFDRYTREAGLPSDDIRTVYLATDGVVWVGTRNGLARRHEGGFQSFPTLPAPWIDPDPSVDAGIWTIAPHPDGSVWYSGSRGTARCWPSTGQIERLPEAWLFGSGNVALAPDGALWARASSYVGRFATNSIQGPYEMPKSYPSEMIIDSENRVWFTSDREGLYMLNDGRLAQFGTDQGLTQDWPTALYEDRHHNLWIGMDNGDLNCWSPRRFETLTTNDGLLDPNCWVLCEDHDGAVWIGTDRGVSRAITTATQPHEAVTILDTPAGLDKAISGQAIRALCITRDGTLWTGSGSGLARRRGSAWEFRSLPGSQGANKVRVIHEDHQGILWIGTADGLHRMAPGQPIETLGLEHGLPHVDIRAIHETSSGDLWLGTFGGGIARMSGAKVIEVIGRRHGLQSLHVWAIHEDADGLLWFGSDRGLVCRRDGRFHVFTTREHGLFDDVINEVLEDAHGRFWLSSDRGIFRVERKALLALMDGQLNRVECTAYSQAEGMPNSETNGQKSQPAGCRTRDGRLWFPTTHGVVIIDPSRFPETTPGPRPFVTHIHANGKQILDRDAGLHGHNTTPASSVGFRTSPTQVHRRSSSPPPLSCQNPVGIARLDFAPGTAKSLEIQFAAVDLLHAPRTQYRYRLQGLNGSWVDAGDRTYVVFATLAPGRYRFECQAADLEGDWGPSSTPLELVIAPHYWQTAWFKVSALACSILVALGWGYRRLRHERQTAALERENALARERERLARDLHDDLGEQIVKLRSECEKLAPSLVAASLRLGRTLSDAVWAVDPDRDALEPLASFMIDFLARELRDSPVTLDLDFPQELPFIPLSPGQRNTLRMCVREALGNTLKHAQATRLKAMLRWESPHLTIELTDNGLGFEPEKVRHQGRGLRHLHERMTSIGGHCSITSAPGQGTRVRLELQVSSATSETERA